jgi:hypothetical protein
MREAIALSNAPLSEKVPSSDNRNVGRSSSLSLVPYLGQELGQELHWSALHVLLQSKAHTGMCTSNPWWYCTSKPAASKTA